MARSVATAGMALRVWNRNRTAAAPLADVGAVVCASPDDACRGAVTAEASGLATSA
jgi:3-hydroxyisobutyrate dehydrogenase